MARLPTLILFVTVFVLPSITDTVLSLLLAHIDCVGIGVDSNNSRIIAHGNGRNQQCSSCHLITETVLSLELAT